MNTCWRCKNIQISDIVLEFQCALPDHEIQDGEHDCPDFNGEAGTDREVRDE